MSNILRFAKVREKSGLSRATVYRRIRAGTFPAPINLSEDGGPQLGWLEEEVDDWVAARPRHVPKGHGRPKSEATVSTSPAPKTA